ncbi:unnamed protein product, partial [marine sediment metagenome]
DGIVYTADADAIMDVVEDDDANGCLSILTTADDDDLGYGYTVADSMRLRDGKKFFMKTKFELTVTTVATSCLFIGLCDSLSPATSTPAFMPATGLHPVASDDVIGFVKYNAESIVNGVIGENNVHDHVPLHTMVTAVWVTLGMYFDGTDLYMYVNDVPAAAITPSAIPISQMGPVFWLRAHADEVTQLLVDYLFVAAER